MKLDQNLYVGSRIRNKEEEIRRRIEEGDYPSGLWVITPALNGKDLLDIRPLKDFRKSCFSERAPKIFAIAAGKTEAVSLLETMIADCIKETGTTQINEYFRRRSE